MNDEQLTRKFTLPEATWAAVGIVFSWALVISQVRHHWGGESYYNFGYFVPPLAVYLLLRNLTKLPANSASELKPGIRQKFVYDAATFICLVPVILFHALSEVNPFWRVPLWAQAFCISLFTLMVSYRFLGWKGVRAVVFPLFYLLTMIPWPFRFEVLIVQSLTQVVTFFAVDGLHFLSYPVEMAGNTIRLGDITIGVNEACSGIRSLQALFMVTLFLGSLFGQSLLPRLLALAVLPLIVIVINSIRAIFLSIQVIVNGDAAYEEWHDPAGYIAFGISMLLIYAAIEGFNLLSKGSADSQQVDLKGIARKFKGTVAPIGTIAYAAAPVLVFLLVESWFLAHEYRMPESRTWELNLPDPDDPEYQYTSIHRNVESALGYSFGYRFNHRLSSRSLVDVYYYGFTRDNKLSSVSSYGHTPTICMEGSGAVLVDQLDDFYIDVGDLRIPVKQFVFEFQESGEPLNIFWTVWENRNMDVPPESLIELTAKAAWIQLRHGRRDFSRKVLLASIAGISDPEVAQQRIKGLFGEWITVSGD